MAKIKVDIPNNIIAQYSVPIRITDINYGNHVGNDAFVSIIHDARMQWLSEHGMTELSIDESGLIMAALSFEFKAEASFGDNILVEIAVGDISTVKFDLYYRLSTKRDSRQIVVANAVTVMVSYDYGIGKPVTIPGKLLKILK